MLVTCRIDTRNLMRAHDILHAKTRQLPSEALHRTVAFVLKDAKDHTPVTSIATIDSELGAISSPAILKSGALSKDKKKQLAEVDVDAQSLAARIVLARLHPNSRGYRGGPGYNQLTGQKWAIDRATFSPGLGRAGFWSRVIAVAERMVKTRHSSPNFLKITWNAVGQKLVPFLPPSYQGWGAAMFGAVNGKNGVPALGEFVPAKSGALSVSCIVEARMGMSGDNAVLDEKRNKAMHQILGPVFQASINREAESKMAKISKDGLMESKAELAACGILMT